MKGVLVGIELSGSTLTLTKVDRRGVLDDSCTFPLSPGLGDWRTSHPDAYHRQVGAALSDSIRNGFLRASQVAAIGLACDPVLVLLDNEFKATNPKHNGLEDLPDGPLHVALRELHAKKPRVLGRAGMVFGLGDYLRFRMTKAIATSESFAAQTGWIESRAAWAPEDARDGGPPNRALPPIFPAGWKVGVLDEETQRTLGMGRQVWVAGGSTPRAAELFVATEPVPGTCLLMLRGDDRVVYRAASEPSEDPSRNVPVPVPNVWYVEQRNIAVSDPRRANPGRSESAWQPPEDEQWTIDTRDGYESGDWRAGLAGDSWVAWDAHSPSCGPAIQAGMALGWFGDLRRLWRKSRAALSKEDWATTISSWESNEETHAASDGDAREIDGGDE